MLPNQSEKPAKNDFYQLGLARSKARITLCVQDATPLGNCLATVTGP